MGKEMGMSYFIQTNHFRSESPLTEEEWDDLYHHEGWHTIGCREDLEGGKASFIRHSNLARVIWLSRLLDSDGNVVVRYNPERDMRLPGCRWRMIQRNAYYLWESASKPMSDGVEFWLQAEKDLNESNG